MWALAVTEAQKEFSVRDELNSLGLAVFCPYTREKVRAKLPSRGRAVFRATWQSIPLWPRYIFARAVGDAALGMILAVRAVHYIVRASEGEPSYLSDAAMEKLSAGCNASGQVVRRAELHDFSVGELLRFVGGSSFAGRSGEVLSIHDSGAVRLLVDGYTKATVDYRELATA